MNESFPLIFSVYLFSSSRNFMVDALFCLFQLQYGGHTLNGINTGLWKIKIVRSVYAHVRSQCILRRNHRYAPSFVCENVAQRRSGTLPPGPHSRTRRGYEYNICRLVTECLADINNTMTPCQIKFCHLQVGIRHQP
jgi:hypothetical protein